VSAGAGYWEARWREGRIGFHESTVNEYLRREWLALGVPAGASVLVPLCGKAHDLAWLARGGWRVIGVEICEEAVAAFFAERDVQPARHRIGAFECWSDGPLAILRGDFFAVDPDLLAAAAGGGAPSAWWDRAALVALPAPERRRYAERLAELLPAAAPGLLVAFEYPQAEMEGPPYAVEEAEVRARFGAPAFAEPRLLERRDLTLDPAQQSRRLSRLHDAVWLLQRAASG
jgi:thiopurine S-methyltransferase